MYKNKKVDILLGSIITLIAAGTIFVAGMNMGKSNPNIPSTDIASYMVKDHQEELYLAASINRIYNKAVTFDENYKKEDALLLSVYIWEAADTFSFVAGISPYQFAHILEAHGYHEVGGKWKNATGAAGEKGIWQLLPATATMLQENPILRYKLGNPPHDLTNNRVSVMYAALYLSIIYANYPNASMELKTSGYNSGEGDLAKEVRGISAMNTREKWYGRHVCGFYEEFLEDTNTTAEIDSL